MARLGWARFRKLLLVCFILALARIVFRRLELTESWYSELPACPACYGTNLCEAMQVLVLSPWSVCYRESVDRPTPTFLFI